MNLSIILPSIWRIERLREAVTNLADTTQGLDVEIVVVAGDDDTAQACASLPVRCVTGGNCAVQAYNVGSIHARGDWLMPCADDQRFLPGWLDEALGTPNAGFVGLNEGSFTIYAAGYFLIRREVIHNALGGAFLPPVYRSWCADLEVSEHMHRAGLFTMTKRVVLEHLHYSLAKSPDDATYEHGRKWHAGDEAMYALRKAQGFPITWSPILTEAHAYA